MLIVKNIRVSFFVRVALTAFCCFVLGALAEGAPIAVLYPDVREPYNSIFRDIVDGIKRETSSDVKSYTLKKGDELDNIRKWLTKRDPKAVVLLGKRGKYLADELSADYKTVTGAVILSNKYIDRGLVGISLSPAPSRLFAKLKELAPSVKRVTVVYHPETNGWLVELAKATAAEANLELVALAAKDVREAATIYRDVLSKQDNGQDAIWLLQGDPTLDERGLLPTILNQAWSEHSIVFSSNPSHVKRGALFSLYPDNFNMGKSLANKVEKLVDGEVSKAEPLKDLLVAVNVRTAEHLNLNISRANERKFDLVFPSR